MPRFGRDDLDTHESTRLRWLEGKYDPGRRKRHAGENRLQHRKKK